MFHDIKKTTIEVLQAILPITIIIIIFQFTFVKMPAGQFVQFIIGTLMVAAGMILFLLGVKIGLLPIGESIGGELPKHNSLFYVIGIIFIIGFAITIAEPNVLILCDQINIYSGGSLSANTLLYVTAIGIGIFASVGAIRIIFNLPLTYFLIPGYGIVLILALFTPHDFIPLAFDSGGFSTGIITVPFILALGLGLSSVLGRRSTGSEGFGIIGLACLGPMLGMMLLGVLSR
ncbi:MAG: DUF1538 domain-containing protein [Chloroflexi bacterium]|nr:DUF1538 domain-containing protein [Chloroflexota bacterium]